MRIPGKRNWSRRACASAPPPVDPPPVIISAPVPSATLAPVAGSDLDLQVFLAIGFATTENYDRALSYTRSVLEADPDRFGAMGLEARIYQALGDYPRSVERALDSLHRAESRLEVAEKK